MPPRSLRHATIGALAAVALAACGAAVLTLAVPTITIPGDSTAGTVCYARGEVTTRLGISHATYDAVATYRTNALIGTSTAVDVVVYGRSSAPSATCVAVGPDDRPLGGPFTLEADEPLAVTVGAGEAGTELAALVRGGEYWLGVALDGGFSLGGERSITFEQGRVRVRF
jgi:hypothetical protein